MEEVAAAEINAGGRLQWVATAASGLGARDPVISN
jgi:hypothetical protein